MHGIKGLRFALLLGALFIYQSHHGGLLSARHAAMVAPVAPASSAREAWCDDTNICNDEAACNTECVNRDVNPHEYSTCGDFYGGWEDGYCVNQCGNPRSCDDYEDFNNCPSDCGYCGDGWCQSYYESYGDCNDCGYCGDGTCNAGHESCSGCGDDCNPNSLTCGAGDPGSTSGCDSGQRRNGQGECCVQGAGSAIGHCPLCDYGQQCVEDQGIYYCVGYDVGCLSSPRR